MTPRWLDVERLVLGHGLGGVSGDRKGAGEEDMHGMGENVDGRRLPSRLITRPPGPGPGGPPWAMTAARRGPSIGRRVHRLGNRGLVHDVGVHIDRAVAELLGQRFAALIGHIGNHDPGAALGQPPRRGAAKSAGAAGNQDRSIFKFHGCFLARFLFMGEVPQSIAWLLSRSTRAGRR